MSGIRMHASRFSAALRCAAIRRAGSSQACRSFVSSAASRETVASAQTASYTGPAPEPIKSRLSALLLFIPSMGAAGLMFWQLQRYQWKIEQIEERTAKIHQTPVSIAELHALGSALQKPGVASDKASSPFWRQIVCRGELMMDKAQYVGPRMRNVGGATKQGYLQIVPMAPADKSAPVLVNRGWVPTAEKEKGSTAPMCVDTIGVVRPSETPVSFMPDQGAGKWYWVDVPAIAEMCGLPRDTPLVEVVGTTPKQKEATSEELKKYLEFPVDPSHHLQYAATWFALSAATAVIARGAVKKQWARQSRRAA